MTVKATVEIWVPLKSYRLTIKHKILSELGELSHFFLKAMSTYSMNKDDIEKVTGLNSCQLQPIIERLKGLRLLSHRYELTESGKMLAYILTNIHDKSLQLVIDQHYNEPLDLILLLPSNSPKLKALPVDAIKAPKPKRLRINSIEDEYLQSQRIQRKLHVLLPKLVPEFEVIIPKLDERWGIEWDIKIERDKENTGKGICLNVPLKSYQEKLQSDTKSKKDILLIYTQLLVLETIFSTPKGLDFENNSPGKMVAIYSENDGCIYNDYSIVSKYAEDVLNNIDDSELDKHALALMDNTVSRLTDYHQSYSRTYEFSKKWQHHEYSYLDMIKYIDDIDLIKG